MDRLANKLAALVVRRERGLRQLFAATLLVLPRVAPAYIGYSVAPLVLLNWKRLDPVKLLGFLGLLGYSLISLAVASAGNVVSLTAWALEMALLLPFLLFILDFPVAGSSRQIVQLLRAMNITILVVSVVKMPIDGIPYITAAPDFWNGFFGLGGAKIVTVIGLFGVLQELLLREHGQRLSRLSFICSIVNFVLPSFLLGLVCGAVALTVAYIKSPKLLVPILIVILPLTWFVASGRADTVNSAAHEINGVAPKEFAYIASFSALTDGGLLGTGAGQFTSTPQTWLDPGLQASARHSVPNLPGFIMSSQYAEQVAPYTSIGLDRRYAVASSLNQPMTGWSSLIAEWGAAAIAIVVLFLRRIREIRRRSALAAGAFFFIGLNAVDPWLDMPWMSACLIALFGLAKALRSENVSDNAVSAVESSPIQPRSPRERPTPRNR